MVLGPYDPALIGAVTLFDNQYCWGDSARFYWDPQDPVGGQYYWNDLNKAGFAPRKAGSIAIPRGYYVELFDSGALQLFKDKTHKVTLHGSYDDEDSQ